MKKITLHIKCFLTLLWLLLKEQFRQIRSVFSKENRLESKLADAIVAQERLRDDTLADIRLAVLEFKEKGGRSKYIPKEINTKTQLFEYLKDKHHAVLKRAGFILTPNLKLLRK
jgi:hypothetical protein